jgi:hypothetical protein
MLIEMRCQAYRPGDFCSGPFRGLASPSGPPCSLRFRAGSRIGALGCGRFGLFESVSLASFMFDS